MCVYVSVCVRRYVYERERVLESVLYSVCIYVFLRIKAADCYYDYSMVPLLKYNSPIRAILYSLVECFLFYP